MQCFQSTVFVFRVFFPEKPVFCIIFRGLTEVHARRCTQTEGTSTCKVTQTLALEGSSGVGWNVWCCFNDCFFFLLFWLSNCQINWCAICYCVVSCHSHGNPWPPVMEMQVRSELTFSDYLLWAEPRSTTQWRDGVSSAWWTNGSENWFKIIVSSSRIWKDKHQLCRFIVCEVRKFAFLIPGFSNQGLRNRPYQQDHFKFFFFFSINSKGYVRKTA